MSIDNGQYLQTAIQISQPLVSNEPDPHQVFDNNRFWSALEKDILQTRALVLIQSPYISLEGAQRLFTPLKLALKNGACVCVFIQQPRNWSRRHRSGLSDAMRSQMLEVESGIKLLQSIDIHVSFRDLVYQSVAIIDNSVVWSGGASILSHYPSDDRMTRWQHEKTVLRTISEHNLDTCEECSLLNQFGLFSGNLDSQKASVIIGKELSSRRKVLHLKQSQVAQLAKLQQNLISRVESGKRNVRIRTLMKISSALELELVLVPRYMVPAVLKLIHDYNRSVRLINLEPTDDT